jgi:large subunit ribosomal protein L21
MPYHLNLVMFAVIETGGKQYLVKTGDSVVIEKLAGEVGATLTFDKVLLVAEDDGTDVKIGTPYLSGATVEGTVEKQGRSRKLRVVKYKRKVRYHKAYGHRQQQTKVTIAKV